MKHFYWLPQQTLSWFVVFKPFFYSDLAGFCQKVEGHNVLFWYLIWKPKHDINIKWNLIVGERAGIKTNVIVPMATSRLTEDIFPPGKVNSKVRWSKMGNDSSLGVSFLKVSLFWFFLNLYRQLSNRNPYMVSISLMTYLSLTFFR